LNEKIIKNLTKQKKELRDNIIGMKNDLKIELDFFVDQLMTLINQKLSLFEIK